MSHPRISWFEPELESVVGFGAGAGRAISRSTAAPVIATYVMIVAKNTKSRALGIASGVRLRGGQSCQIANVRKPDMAAAGTDNMVATKAWVRASKRTSVALETVEARKKERTSRKFERLKRFTADRFGNSADTLDLCVTPGAAIKSPIAAMRTPPTARLPRWARVRTPREYSCAGT